MEGYRDILIFGEKDGDRLSPMTTQLMRIGKALSGDLKEELHLLLLGGESNKNGDVGFGYGADRVYAGTDPLLEDYMTDTYLQAMSQVVEELKPLVILFGQNDKGLDLAPRLAFRLKTGVTLDCVDLRIDSEKGVLEAVKPLFGGKAYAHYCALESRPQIASVREGAFDPAEYDESITGEVLQLTLSLDPSRVRTRLVKKEKDVSLALALRLASAPSSRGQWYSSACCRVRNR